jgi:hypothetical protein
VGNCKQQWAFVKDPQRFSHLPKKKRVNDVGSIWSTMTNDTASGEERKYR